MVRHRKKKRRVHHRVQHRKHRKVKRVHKRRVRHHYPKRKMGVVRGKHRIMVSITMTPHNNKRKDKRLVAKIPGKRRSRRNKTYYEYRVNRVDVNPRLRY